MGEEDGKEVAGLRNGKKAKRLRRQVTGDPDMDGRTFAKRDNITTWMLHPHSERAQYRELKRRKA